MLSWLQLHKLVFDSRIQLISKRQDQLPPTQHKDLDMNRIAKSSYPSAVFDEDSQLNQAIQMSLQTNLTTTATSNQNVTELSPNTIRRKRLEHFEQLNKKE